jgi:hypothetical protein
MNYIRTFTGKNALKSLGEYAAFDFTKIESVVMGTHQVMESEIPTDGNARNKTVELKGTTVRFVTGNALFLQGDDEKNFCVVWDQFVAESQQQERVKAWQS